MTTPDHSEGVNAEIRAGMARKELTQSDVASALGLSQASVNDRLKGRRAWRLDELLKVAALLGVQASDLLPVPVADAGHAAPQMLARAAVLLAATLLAVVVGWNAPAGTPLAVLLAVGSGYTIARLLGAGALAVGRHQRAGGGR